MFFSILVTEPRKSVEGALGGLLGFSLVLLIIFLVLCIKLRKEIQNLHNKLEKAYQDFGHVNEAFPIADKMTPPKRSEHPSLMNDDYLDPNNRNYVLPKTYPSYHPKHENYVMPNPNNSTARPSQTYIGRTTKITR